MEREYNRNQRSYRPRRSDSRDDYQPRKEERQEQPVYKERRERRDFNGNQPEKYTGREQSRNSRFSERRPNRNYTGGQRQEEVKERGIETGKEYLAMAGKVLTVQKIVPEKE